jgi:aspartate aminotransferase
MAAGMMMGLSHPSLSSRTNLLKPSPTLGIAGRAKAMAAQGIDVISFSVGEPDFNTPEAICNAAIAAIQAGKTKYTPSAGTPELRQEIAGALSKRHDLDISADRIVVSCGAKHSVYNTLQVLVDPGDEVILLAPYWMTYADQVQLAGGTPVVVQTLVENGYNPTVEQLRAAITPKTKAIILNSPSNPTGGMLDFATINAIGDLAKEHNFWIISDEIYDQLVYEGTHVSITALGPELMDRSILINGCSKSYAMTGWRIGYAFAPVSVAKAMSNLQDQVTSNPTSFAQSGAVEAFRMSPDAVEAMRTEFHARRDLAVRLVRDIPQLSVDVPKGAFYLFVNVEAYLGSKFATDSELAEFLLEESYVATVPGSVFCGPGHLRLSYATSRDQIESGLSRIKSSLARL